MTKTLTLVEQILALQAMHVPELVGRYEQLFGRPPRSKQPAWLRSRLAWKLQADALGGLSRLATRRLAGLRSEIELPDGDAAKAPRTERARLRDDDPRRPRVGTVLTRQWHGRELRVTVVDAGYEHAGVSYRTLSAVAKAITGSHWNGRAFFNVTPRRRSKS